jgi:transcriptional regulator with XRE-family HTH domain
VSTSTDNQVRSGPLLQDVDALLDARIEARLSATQLAGLAGISVPHYCQAEKGGRSLSARFLIAIAAVLRCPASKLLNPEYARTGDRLQVALIHDASRSKQPLRPDAQCVGCDEPWSPQHACGETATQAGSTA